MKLSIYILILIAIIVMLIIRLITNTIHDKNKKQDPTDDKLVIDDLAVKGSTLYRYISLGLDNILKDDESDRFTISYDFYKLHIVSTMVNEVDIECRPENGGYKWLNSGVYEKITSDNLQMAIETIMNMPEIDSIIAKSFSSKIEHNVKMAEDNEKIAINANKEYEAAPGKDEELHPRIPQPGENSDEEISERSIEELSSMGTVESIDE